MGNTELENAENTRIQGILDRYLASGKGIKSSAGETSLHLDEDALAAFAEGNLTRRESLPVLDHLVACKFCRHKTAELVRLDLALAGNIEETERVSASAPSKISAVLSDVLSKIFGTTDGAVFAHEDKKDEEEKSEDSDEQPK